VHSQTKSSWQFTWTQYIFGFSHHQKRMAEDSDAWKAVVAQLQSLRLELLQREERLQQQQEQLEEKERQERLREEQRLQRET